MCALLFDLAGCFVAHGLAGKYIFPSFLLFPKNGSKAVRASCVQAGSDMLGGGVGVGGVVRTIRLNMERVN